MPTPVETYLSDLLQFERVLDDGHTIRTKSGGLVQTITLRGFDVGGLSSAELDAMLVRRKAWFEKVAEAGLFAKVITTRDNVSYALDAEYEDPVLQAIHDEWTSQFACVYVNRDHIVVSAPNDDRNAFRALRDAVRDACDALSQYGPQLLDNGSEAYSPLLSFWAGLVNGFPYAVGSFVDKLSERLVATTVEFEVDHAADGKPVRVPGLIRHEDGARTLYSMVLSLSEWGEESSAAILRDLLRLDGRVTVLQFIKGVPKTAATAKMASSRAAISRERQRTSRAIGLPSSSISFRSSSWRRRGKSSTSW